MSNKYNSSHTEEDVAENCKKVLKNVKIANIGIAAAVCAAVITAAGFSMYGNEIPLSAELVQTENIETAVKTLMPPREYDVKISVDGRNIGVRCAGTVKDALDFAGVEIDEHDLINIGFSEPLNENTKIVVNRVDIVEEVQVEVLEYATKYTEDDSYTIGYSETIVDGAEGEVETTLRHVYVDGELISSDVIDEDVTDPVDEVIVVGTKKYNPIDDYSISELSAPLDLILDEDGVPLDYSQVFTGKSCAYSARPGALTASGRQAAVGIVAVDPSIIPYGTELYIATTDGSKVYGYAIAGDTGTSLLRGDILVDLYMNTIDECYQWGARQVNIYVLN